MARRFFRKYTPHPDRIRAYRVLRLFGKILHRPNLWHLNRTSVSRGFAVGMFWAFIPMPFQMLPSAFCAIQFRANFALSVALVWITNPFTMPAFYYVQYLLGRRLLGRSAAAGEDSLLSQFMNWRNWIDWNWITSTLTSIGVPLYTGSLVVAVGCSVLSYFGAQLFWRWNIRRKWAARALRPESAGRSKAVDGTPGQQRLRKSA